MIKILFSTILAILLSGVAILAQQTEDERAIIALIKAETEAFANESLAATAEKFWILDSHSVRCVSYEDGNNYQHRYLDLISSDLTPPSGKATFTQSEIATNVMGTIASVTYIQEAIISDGPDTLVLYSRELVVAEKVNGSWRIHMKSVHYHKKT